MRHPSISGKISEKLFQRMTRTAPYKTKQGRAVITARPCRILFPDQR